MKRNSYAVRAVRGSAALFISLMAMAVAVAHPTFKPVAHARAHTALRLASYNGQSDVHTVAPEATTPESSAPEKYRISRDDSDQAHGYHFSKIVRGNKGKKLLALTFDDGPHAVYTEELVNILKETHTPATFFLVGKQVDKFPELVKMEALGGFELGNHTYDHVDLTQIPPELIGYELDECNRAILRASGQSARFFRPPGGNYDGNVVREASRRSYVTTLWTDDPGDYAKPGADIVLKRTVDRLENGAIILLHDGIPETLNILPTLINEAHKRGYEFVTVSELARQR